MTLKCDLHIHSCLSPCGSLDMSPSEIVRIAIEKKLDVIAIADHNSALNAPAMETLCRDNDLIPLFAIEATSSEEFHSLCIFDSAEEAVELGNIFYKDLLSRPNIPEKFGDQVYVDEEDGILGELEKYLTGGALPYSSDVILKMVHERKGLFIPAHIDRAAFSLGSQLGFVPPDPYDALEVTSWPIPLKTGDFPLLCNSDAHYPEDIGKRYFQVQCEERNGHSVLQAIKEGKTSLSIRF